MNDKPRSEVIIVQESIIESIIKDVMTFAMFGGLLWFNHAYLSGSTIIDILFIALVLIVLITKKSSIVFSGTKKDAIKHLQGTTNV